MQCSASLFARTMLVGPSNLAPRALGFVTKALYFGGAIGPIILAPMLWYLNLRTMFLLMVATIAMLLCGAAIRSLRMA
mgnify:CR=1 FL=1